jgi:hypothetical protein
MAKYHIMTCSGKLKLNEWKAAEWIEHSNLRADSMPSKNASQDRDMSKAKQATARKQKVDHSGSHNLRQT